jgi:hypothetical protein
MKYANLVAIIVFVSFMLGLTIPGLAKAPAEISTSERRMLAQFPELSLDEVFDGSFAEDYATFLQDQVVLRDDFRAVKSFVERGLLLKSENNDVYVIDGNIYDKFYGINQRYIDRAALLMNEIIGQIDSDRVYVSVIPSKAQMLDRSKYLLSDQDDIAGYLRDHVYAEYIDLMGLAVEGNETLYYTTDHHWTTQGAIQAYERLVRAMGYEPIDNYAFEELTDSYVGSNYGKAAARSIGKDSMHLAHNEYLDNMSACRYETLEIFECSDSVYFREEADGLDPYDVFLGGLGPIIVIESSQAQSDEELIIFKDSYSHVLAPFLAQHFSKVTLFDLRYVRRELLLDSFDLTGKAVLFLYSTTILNTDPQILN